RMSDLTDRSRGGDSGARSELSRQGAAQAASLTLVAYAAAHRPVWQTLQDYAARHKNRAGEIAREIVSRTPEPK
ncbi:MAG: hypothetical protein K2Q10_06175, partial [Rhodospirillales bacterium]|nr:hypothetical protein [Rhodospirillales bacterium]